MLSACGAKDADPPASAPASTAAESPRFLDENSYAGDELEIVKLINLRIKYAFEGNESEYMKLFVADSPISGLPRYRLLTVRPTEVINIVEQKSSFVATVRAEDTVDTGEAFNNTYVFVKPKNGDAVWKIADID